MIDRVKGSKSMSVLLVLLLVQVLLHPPSNVFADAEGIGVSRSRLVSILQAGSHLETLMKGGQTFLNLSLGHLLRVMELYSSTGRGPSPGHLSAPGRLDYFHRDSFLHWLQSLAHQDASHPHDHMVTVGGGARLGGQHLIIVSIRSPVTGACRARQSCPGLVCKARGRSRGSRGLFER